MKTNLSGILTLFMAFIVQFTFAQEKTITGTVTDAESGMPLVGVNIIIEGTSTGTLTDFDGKYSLEVSAGQTLMFSYLGYSNKSVTVGSDTTIDVRLEASAAELDEVVITALGIKRKKDEITSSHQVVETKELTQAAAPTVVKGLTGKVTGLTIKTNSGVGSDPRIVLRAGKSMTGNNEALIVIDGAVSTVSFLQTLDPNTVASINVIKGPSGAALYGSQGANGVIIVTTKKGSDSGKLTVSLRSSVQFESTKYTPEVATVSGQGWSYNHVMHENGMWGPLFGTTGEIAPIGFPQADGDYIYAPWQSRGAYNSADFFETGATYLNSVRIAAGDADGYLALSARNQNTEFVVENDKIKRTTFTFNGGKTMGNWEISGNAKYSYTTLTKTTGDLMGDLYQTPTNVPIEQFEGSGNAGHWNGYFFNPYWLRDNIRRNTEANRFNVSGQIKYTFNDHISTLLKTNGLFTFKNNLNYTNGYADSDFVQAHSGYQRTVTSSFDYGLTSFARYNTTSITNFDYDLTKDIGFKANIGFNSRYTKNRSATVGGEGLTIPGIYSLSNLSSTPGTVTGDDRSAQSSIGVFASLDFSYQDFIYLHLTGRNDWTSTLPKSNNSFFYPSAGLSFIPTKAFPELESDVLNYWKIKGSYVMVGNADAIGPYDIQSVYVQAPGYPFAGVNSFVNPGTITDPLLEPEFTTSYEFSMNFGFFNNRITLDANYYNFTTDNQIVSIATSSASGIESSSVNLGKTKGHGLELTLGVTPIDTENLTWNIRMGYSNPENEVVKVSDQAKEVSLGGTDIASATAVEGLPYPVMKGTAYKRDSQGRVVIDPGSGNPIVASDYKVLGQITPDYIVNLNSSISYKGFSLSATLDYRTGHVFYAGTMRSFTFSGYLVESRQAGNGAFIWPNSSYESPAGSGEYVGNTNIPTGGTTPGSYINLWSDYADVAENYVLDATALKLREVSLSYTFDSNTLKNTFFDGITLTAVGRNLLTVLPKENRGYSDPSASALTGNAQGFTDTSIYPPTRTIGMVVNLTF